MRFEIKEGQNEEKWKKHFLQFEKMYFFYFSFLASHLALHFKNDL
jgi:hypothetical protein